MDQNKLGKQLKPALAFIFLMGIVSMFSDMTHEGARSIYGVYLSLAGASAAAIGFAAGFGEFVGYAFRLVAGYITDRKKNYWFMTIVGYLFNMAAIPALALIPENGWILACALIIIERMGKAIRYPAKNTLVSFAATQVGHGKSFAIQEFLDQLGAFLGPVILFITLYLKKGENTFSAYALCFAILGIPAFLTLVALLVSKWKYPAPESFDVSPETRGSKKLRMSFIIYMAAASLLALGFADFPLITMHVFRKELVASDLLPLLYAGAMLADAVAALFFGWLYDKWGIRVLMISTAISASFAVFIFTLNSLYAAIIGIVMWGIGMGAQESILKSVVSNIVPKESRATGFGVFETAFGIFWFLGSWLMGALYDIAPNWLVVFSVSMQLLAIPVFYTTWTYFRREEEMRQTAHP
ncbi:MAG: MFS transporter [Syntrophomonadaceae bacterium]|nr:MFS transporter [Syntrophomonadaceae bacterium]